MLVKLTSSIAGDRFSYRPRQVIKCSDKAGARLIAAGVAVEAPAGSESEGHLPETVDPEPAPVRRRGPETAAKAAPESATTVGAPAHCTGTTAQGNPCLRKPLAGKERCAQHSEDV